MAYIPLNFWPRAVATREQIVEYWFIPFDSNTKMLIVLWRLYKQVTQSSRYGHCIKLQIQWNKDLDSEKFVYIIRYHIFRFVYVYRDIYKWDPMQFILVKENLVHQIVWLLLRIYYGIYVGRLYLNLNRWPWYIHPQFTTIRKFRVLNFSNGLKPKSGKYTYGIYI